MQAGKFASFNTLIYFEHAQSPFVELGAIFTGLYFSWYLILVPMVGLVENTLMDVATDNNS